MKKLLLSLALSLGALAATPVMAAAPAFPTSQMSQVKIKDLSFNQLMNAFYKGQTREVKVNIPEIANMPHIGLDLEEDGTRRVAILHPVVTYRNSSDDLRYLVLIEKVRVTSDQGRLIACERCYPAIDLYSFKRLNEGGYQLVSRTAPQEPIYSGYWGRVHPAIANIKNDIQPLGKNLVGSIYSNYLSVKGSSSITTVKFWEALFLSEKDYISTHHVANAGNSIKGEDGMIGGAEHNYEISYKVIPQDTKYYPIRLTSRSLEKKYDSPDAKYNHSTEEVFFNTETQSYE